MEKIEQQEKQQLDFKNLDGGLEILVQLAEKGDIDPWDVDVIEVTEKYLKALNKTPRENLLNAGRAIFYASVLLRLKSDMLLNISNETLTLSQQTENFFPEDDLLLEDGKPYIDLTRLESFIVRSTIGKQQRKRKISLGDLIFALQQAEEEEERRAQRARLRQERAFTIAPIETPEDFLEIAHEEDIEDVVKKIEAIIQEHLTEEKPLTLSFLTSILNDKLNIFLGLLFLANFQKIVLDQEKMYEEVFIYKPGVLILREEAEKQREKEREKDLICKKAKKKGIFEKIREKVTRRRKEKPTKVIEVISDGKEVVDVNITQVVESEVIEDGNTSTSG